MTWMRLEVKSMRVGWTASLPAPQYAAWVKFLLEVKESGLHGRCKASYFDAEWSRRYHIPAATFSKVMARAVTERAVTLLDGFYEVTHWGAYQPDLTHAKRQENYRERQKGRGDSAKGGVTESDGSDAHSTLQHSTATSTAQDSTENKEVAVVAAPPGAATAKTEERPGDPSAVPAAAETERPLTEKLKRIQEALVAPVVETTGIQAAGLLGSAGLPADVAARLGIKYGYDRVRQVLGLVLKRRADNPPGMVRQALEERWTV